MLDKFKWIITNECRLKKGDRILLALSGGVDSMLMMKLFLSVKKELGIELDAFHLDHMYRGKESFQDFKFVKKYAKENDFTLYAYRRDINKISLNSAKGFELTARQVRYDLLNVIKKIYHYDFIATAHHKDDNAESILMHFVRGSGLKGLSGMSYRDKNYIRPLLDFDKTDIVNFAEKLNLSYRVDSTNSNDKFTRNKFRLNIIPMIEEINPAFANNITTSSSFIRKEDAFINAYIEKNNFLKVKEDAVLIDLNELNSLDKLILGRLIIKQFNHFGIYKDVHNYMVEDIEKLAFNKKNGKKKIFHNISFEYQNGLILAEKCVDENIFLKLQDELKVLGSKFLVEYVNEDNYKTLHNKNVIILDAKVLDKLVVRTRVSGDFIIQKNLNGSKKIKKLFSELKFTSEKRKKQLLLCLENEVLWVINERKSKKHYDAIDEFEKNIRNQKKFTKSFIIIKVIPLL